MNRRWLMKSEPSSFSVDDLLRRPDRTEPWDGVRNYQARNLIRDEMKPGDLACLLSFELRRARGRGDHGGRDPAYPDPTAFDPRHHHFDPDSSPDSPRWFLVDVRLVRKLRRIITLTELKAHPELSGLPLLKRGNRLSVMPVSEAHWDFVLGLE